MTTVKKINPITSGDMIFPRKIPNLNQALFKEIRDVSNVTRDMSKVTDIFSTDGAMTAIAEKLSFGLSNVKRARYLLSEEYRRLSGKQAVDALAQRTSELHDETVDLSLIHI